MRVLRSLDDELRQLVDEDQSAIVVVVIDAQHDGPVGPNIVERELEMPTFQDNSCAIDSMALAREIVDDQLHGAIIPQAPSLVRWDGHVWLHAARKRRENC